MNQSDAAPDAILVFGSRSSKLALWQTDTVRNAICQADPSTEWKLETFITAGDKNLAQPLPQIGGKGLFTEELNQAIRAGRIHIAVHSLKDLPTLDEPGIRTIPVLQREDPRDVLISRDQLTLEQLPPNAIVGTSSPRRTAQLLAVRPDLQIKSIRGNVPTRIKKALGDAPDSPYDAVVLAAAGVIRLGLEEHISQFLPLDEFLPAPGQGCVAATCCDSDTTTHARLERIADPDTQRSVTAERMLLHHLGGGCSAPIAAHALVNDNREIELTGRVGSLDGKRTVTLTARGNNPNELAQTLANQILQSGGREILLEVFPLTGKRIVITRSETQNVPLRDLLVSRGATSIDLPLIEFLPCTPNDQVATRLEEAEKASHIVFTSSNAVQFFNHMVPTEKAELWLDKMRFIGPQTAKAMYNVFPDKIYTDLPSYTSETLADALDVSDGDSVLLPVAKVHTPVLMAKLESRGITVAVWPLYETRPCPITPNQKDELRSGFDAVLFASPSAIDSFCDQLPNPSEFLSSAVVACIGPTTRDHAAGRGITVHVTPTRYTMENMVSELENYLLQQQGSDGK